MEGSSGIAAKLEKTLTGISTPTKKKKAALGGGFKYFWFPTLPGEMIQFD